MSNGQFTCPECGSNQYGSGRGPNGTVKRYCHGYKGFGEPCRFSWLESDDQKYGLLPPSPELQVGTTVIG